MLQIEWAKKRSDLAPFKEKLEKNKKEFDNKEKEYYDINKFLTYDYQKLYSKYIEPLKQKIPAIDYLDGVWTFEGKAIESLSKSETMRLALDIKKVQGIDSDIIVIDNAELFDPETAKELQLNQQGATYIFTKVDKPFDIEGSKKIELESNEPVEETKYEIKI